MVFIVIVLREAIAVTQQEAATKQSNSLSYLEISGGIIFIHFLWGNLQNTTGKRLWKKYNRVMWILNLKRGFVECKRTQQHEVTELLTGTGPDFLWQPDSAHQAIEGFSPTVGFIDKSDLYCIVH